MRANKKERRRVEIPEKMNYRSFTLKSKSDNSVVAVVTLAHALKTFSDRDVFPWYLFIKSKTESPDLLGISDDIEKEKVLDYAIKLNDLFNPNDSAPQALLVALQYQIGENYILFQVHNSDHIDNILKEEIAGNKYSFNFEYKMEYDQNWESVSDLLS
ncbi:MAG: hypothetical protein MK105_17655 [Crocinitomicaceae bacterium]|nr:hypothetical protein [Crocinitomicaceae bacterium]